MQILARALLLPLLLVGCATRSLSVAEYVLTSTDPPRATLVPGAEPDPVIGVGPVRVPAYLRRPEIVAREPGGRLHVRQSQRWGEDLQSSVGRILAKDLSRLVPSDRIFVEPWRAPNALQFRVGVQIRHFERVGDSIELEATYGVARGTGWSDAALKLHSASIRQPVADAETQTVVAAMNRALGALSAELAEAGRRALAAAPPSGP